MIWLVWRRLANNSNWSDVIDSHLLSHLVIGNQSKIQNLGLWLMCVAWVLTTIAMAGPSWQRMPQPVYPDNEHIVFAFDLSRSMDSDDLSPSRLTRARFKLLDLVNAAKGRQQGLVAFAGEAFVVSPLTDDSETLLNLIPSLDTDTVPIQGSRADLGIQKASELLARTGAYSGSIILLTDGVPPDTERAAKEALAQGYKTSVISIGTSQGAPIRLPNGGFLKDHNDNIVLPGVDVDYLQRIAKVGNGIYTPLLSDGKDVLSLMDHATPLLTSPDSDQITQRFGGDQWHDNGVWLLLPLLLIVSFGFRRGWLLNVVIVSQFALPDSSWAFEWQDLWMRDDQQAAVALKNDEFDILSSSSLSDWKGTGMYRLEKYEEAESAFEKQPGAMGKYNLGNTLAKMGKLEQALTAYDQALDEKPNFDDAIFNRDLVKKLLDQQTSQSKRSEQSDSRQDDAGESASGQDDGQHQQPQNNGDSEQANRDSNNQEQSPPSPDTGSGQPTKDQQESETIGAKPDRESDQEEMIQDTQDDQDQQSPSNLGQEMEDEPVIQSSQDQLTDASTESEQALSQWLRQIPDDPGGLLRRKFAYQYQRQRSQSNPIRSEASGQNQQSQSW
ncbi:MAG: VWA domain-containing protein [Gammaproteobacteria bacterium]|nr:VWA domain-containing protein [Gammaproteobacteria bacterium]